MRLPIRVRLTAWYTALLAVIIATIGPFVVLQFSADMKAAIDRDVRRTWRPLAREYAASGLQEFAQYSRTALPRNGADQVFDSGGRLLASWGQPGEHDIIASPRARADALAGRERLLTVSLGEEGESYRVMVAAVSRLGERQVLAAAEPLEPVENSVQRVLTLLLFTVPAALAAAWLAGWWLARKALLPVGRMTAKAEHIGIDRLGERIAVPRAPDELAHLAATLNAMLDRLEHGVAEQQHFVANASHELRTPLAVMRAELDVNLRGDDVSGAAREVLESAREEVDRMSRTVDNLLTLASADEGQLQLLTTRVSLNDEARAAVRSVAPAAAAKGLDLHAEDGLRNEPGFVEADPQRVHQVLVNFIENAIKYTPPGGVVCVRTWRRGDEAGITVSDTGAGIPADARAQVFDRFFRVDSARRRTNGGSGLGLAICREIAEAHGGRVWVESEEGKGSAFSLGLPATTAPIRPAYRVRRGGKLQTGGANVTLRDS